MALGFIGGGLKILGGAATRSGGMKMARKIFKRKDNKKNQQQTQGESSQEISEVGVDKTQNPQISFDSPHVSQSISKAGGGGESESLEGTAFRIKKSVVDIDTLLKGSLALDKMRATKKRRIAKQSKRKKQETKFEKVKTVGKGLGRFVPQKAKSAIGRVINFFVTMFWGFLAMKFFDQIPKLLGLVTILNNVMNWLVKWGGRVLNAFVTLVHWGDKMFQGLRKGVGKLFGEKGQAIFDKLTGTLKWVLNLAAIAALTTAAVLMKSTSLAYWRGFKDGSMGRKGIGGNIFKYGLRRAPKRLLIKLLGKKGTTALLTKGGAAVTAVKTTVGAVVAKGAAIVSGIVSAPAFVVGAAMGLASALGEGGGWLLKKQRETNQLAKRNYENQKDKKWWDPRKWGSWMMWKGGELQNRIVGPFISLLDILGAPIRYLFELIRWPFLDQQGKNKQRKNLAKFDGRIREQFRRFINMFDIFGKVSDETGGFGNIYGQEGRAGAAQKDLNRKLNFDPTADDKSASISKSASYEQEGDVTILINDTGSEKGSSSDGGVGADTAEMLTGALGGGTSGGGSNPFEILHKGA